jgi:hypothetical protein
MGGGDTHLTPLGYFQKNHNCRKREVQNVIVIKFK